MLFASEYLTLNLISHGRILQASWSGPLSETQIRSGCAQILTLRTHYRIACLLNDNTHVSGSWLHSVEWVARTWYPIARREGLQYVAWIYSRNPEAHVAADTALILAATIYELSAEQVPQRLGIRMFEDVEEGQKWLETCIE